MAPRLRNPGVMIGDIELTPAAINAFAAWRRLQRRCTCTDRDCAACEEAWPFERIIARELRTKPWEIPCIRREPDQTNKWLQLGYARYLALERALARR